MMSGKANSNGTSQEITYSNIHRNVTLSPILSQTNQWVWFGFLLKKHSVGIFTYCAFTVLRHICHLASEECLLH